MKTKLPLRILRLPFYPWLAGLLPVLHLFSVNFGSVIESEVPLCIFWVAAGSTIIYLAAYAAARSHHRSALIALCIILGFSLSGHIHALLFDREPLSVWTFVVVIVVTLAVAALIKSRDDDAFAQAALPLNLVFLAMLLPQVATLAANYSDAYTNFAPLRNRDGAPANLENSARVNDSDNRPDVYFIIPDGYPSDSWLLTAMDFDNSAFTDALTARGFTVAPHAQSNYGGTLISLASTLNMRLFYENPTELHDIDYLRLSIANSEVARYFKQLGYTYIQFLSGHLFPSSIADINRDFKPTGTVDVQIDDDNLATLLLDTNQNTQSNTDLRRFHQQSFVALYIETTLLKIIADQFDSWFELVRDRTYDLYSPMRFLETLDEIQSIVEMPEATFSIIHLLKPHRPTVFDENGNIIEKISKPNRAEHLAELRFINTKFIETIDTILAGSKHPPVIIFQADHGSTYGWSRRDGYRLIHFDSYAAYYVPPSFSLEIPRAHTTVNSFPLILNSVFDAGLEFSENRLFELSKLTGEPLKQTDVTEIFAHR